MSISPLTEERAEQTEIYSDDYFHVAEAPVDLLVWVDLETTGLKPATGQILEIHAFTTFMDFDPFLIEEGEMVKGGEHYSSFSGLITPRLDVVWDGAAVEMHSHNGLLDAVRSSGEDEDDVYHAFEDWLLLLKHVTNDGRLTLAGSSPHFDMAWLKYCWPDAAELLHYRLFDASTVAAFMVAWAGEDWRADVHGDWVSDHRAERDLRRSHRICVEACQYSDRAKARSMP